MGSSRSPEPTGGPLWRYEPGFRAELDRLGYAKRTAQGHVALLGQLSRWLDRRGLDASGLTLPVVESFLTGVRATGGWFQPTSRTLMPLLVYLREVGVAPAPVAPVVSAPVEVLLARYGAYLGGERGLASGTIQNYLEVAGCSCQPRSAATPWTWRR